MPCPTISRGKEGPREPFRGCGVASRGHLSFPSQQGRWVQCCVQIHILLLLSSNPSLPFWKHSSRPGPTQSCGTDHTPCCPSKMDPHSRACAPASGVQLSSKPFVPSALQPAGSRSPGDAHPIPPRYCHVAKTRLEQRASLAMWKAPWIVKLPDVPVDDSASQVDQCWTDPLRPSHAAVEIHSRPAPLPVRPTLSLSLVVRSLVVVVVDLGKRSRQQTTHSQKSWISSPSGPHIQKASGSQTPPC
jgi:hypothetical protein